MSVSLLIVEDKERTLQQLLEELRPLNFSITTAKDGLDGLSKAKSEPFDMVITDHKMPVMDGLMLVKNLRELSSYADKPIVFMTTQDLLEVEPLALRAGATVCLGKPLHGEALRRALICYSQRSVA